MNIGRKTNSKVVPYNKNRRASLSKLSNGKNNLDLERDCSFITESFGNSALKPHY